MQPLVWLDFHLAAHAKAQPQAAGVAVSALAARTLHVLHGVFAQHPNAYALALPATRRHLSVLRVFASDRGAMDLLVAAVDPHPVIRDYVSIGFARPVPPDFQGNWLEHRRYRIPTRTADRHEGAPLRRRRIEEADERRLPFFLMHSKRTGQSFSLIVERRPVPAPTSPVELLPDAYGLSRASAPVPLPDLPPP